MFFLLLLFSQSRAFSSPDTDANATFEDEVVNYACVCAYDEEKNPSTQNGCHVHCFSFAM